MTSLFFTQQKNQLMLSKQLEDSLAAVKKEIASGSSLKTLQANLPVIVNCIESLQGATEQSVAAFLVQANKYKSEIEKAILVNKSVPTVEKSINEIEEWFKTNERPNSEAIMKELNEANAHNTKCDDVARIKKLRADVQAKQELHEKKGAEIDKLKDEKKTIFSTNPLPVKNLSFDEDMVYYKGLPFDENSHPSSTIIGVGVKIAMAMNPNLKVIVIKDGSLLDEKIANGILKMIEKEGYQLLIEMVSWKDQETEIKFIEKEITL